MEAGGVGGGCWDRFAMSFGRAWLIAEGLTTLKATVDVKEHVSSRGKEVKDENQRKTDRRAGHKDTLFVCLTKVGDLVGWSGLSPHSLTVEDAGAVWSDGWGEWRGFE